ncbi:NAD(P)-binding domain-containing protein [Bradyrhizobium sp. NP1]|uniref:NADPH-dependent F420 reductase n=1 Tax=Bradyrhizobium sp. NP1 TaxID=3049772 RepID=UPI0025A4E510|nr:NAD(P)-binding domain-containing protein [Bradyrhizobium sp. NP1]WJR76613.1 NAD(P)-binding domain-containing protein [Bradyrhizobium sp. NP1]
MKIAFVGYGNVGAPLADHLQKLGHDVTLAVNDAGSASLRKLLATNPHLGSADPKHAVEGADVVFLATPFQANETALKNVAGELTGKILVDCTNPVGPGLTHGLNNAQSGTEMIQRLVPGAKVVKAFTIYGFENFEDNNYAGYNVEPVMLFLRQ